MLKNIAHFGRGYRFKPRTTVSRVMTGLNSNLPQSIDWRKQGAVSEIRNQGQGETCWAFSAAGAIEGARVASKAVKSMTPLSVQELIDCMEIQCSDGSGTMDDAFEWVREKRNGSLDTFQSYPYVDKDCIFWDPPHKCLHNGSLPSGPGRVTAMHHTIPNNVTDLMLALTRGPVSVAIYSSLTTFTTYKGGIYSDKNCMSVTKKMLDHGVLRGLWC